MKQKKENRGLQCPGEHQGLRVTNQRPDVSLRGAFSTSSMQMCYLATSSMLRLNVAPSAETAGPLPLLVNASLLIMYCQSSDKSYCTSSRETVDGESDIWDSRTHRCSTGLPVTYQTLTEHSVYDNRWKIK